MKIKLLLIICCLLSAQAITAQKNYTLKSPDEKIVITVQTGDIITYTVKHENDVIINPSPLSMTLADGSQWGKKPVVRKATTTNINQNFTTPFYKKANVKDQYNQLTLQCKGDYSITFRAYNDGVAYRFESKQKNDFTVQNEEVVFNFNKNYKSYVPYVRDFNDDPNIPLTNQFFNSFENMYAHLNLNEINPKRYIFLPLLVELENNKKVCITEADLESYPGMYLINKEGNNSLSGLFAPYPKTEVQGGHNELQMLVTEREPYIAKVKGTRTFPWRTMIISTEDKQLADNDMVQKLASPSRIADISWIKPGKVAWDWWNDWNIYGVDFKAGINNDTYKYYIDFASANNIEYVILDEGWSVHGKADLLQVIPEINMKKIVDYAASKNVGIILWAGYHALDRNMENVCKQYSEMGVKGFKVDFMDRDDQKVVDFYYRTAETAAKYKMLVDFHGAYKPTGLQRTYPNVVNFEGVNGLEQLKWSPYGFDMVTYDVTIPFIRMVAGPMDYTQGAMRNASKSNYHPISNEAMSQGTRCRQLAEYVVFESPLNMLCDAPTNYMREPECTKFIAEIPTVWDKTISLDGKIGEYVAIARQKGNYWYLGAMTNWDERELTLDLSFLGEGTFKAEIYKDGINAAKAARDYKHEVVTINGNKKLVIKMAPGGGYAAKIWKE